MATRWVARVRAVMAAWVLGAGAGCADSPARHGAAVAHPPAVGSAGAPARAASPPPPAVAARVPPSIGAASAGQARALQALLDVAVARNGGYGGGILRIERRDGALVWEGAAGRVAHGAPAAMHPDTPFEIASITKTFTAAAALTLCERGLLRLDAPIGSYAPTSFWRRLLVHGTVDHSGEITLRQLLQHTSGLPDYWSDPPFVAPDTNAFLRAFLARVERFWEPGELLAHVRHLQPIGRPGEVWHYADSNYVLAGMILEQVTRRPLRAVLDDTILRPQQMAATYMSYRDPAPSARPPSHRYEASADLHGQMRQSADWASGGLVSTAADLGRLMRALACDVLPARRESRAAMRAWRNTGREGVDYGLGLFRIELDQGDDGDIWGHDGHGNAFMFYWPAGELVLVGTLNQLENDWWPLLRGAVAVLGGPPPLE